MNFENEFKNMVDACGNQDRLKMLLGEMKPMFKTMFEQGLKSGELQSRIPDGYGVFSLSKVKKQCGCLGMAQDGWGRSVVCDCCGNKGYYYEREQLK